MTVVDARVPALVGAARARRSPSSAARPATSRRSSSPTRTRTTSASPSGSAPSGRSRCGCTSATVAQPAPVPLRDGALRRRATASPRLLRVGAGDGPRRRAARRSRSADVRAFATRTSSSTSRAAPTSSTRPATPTATRRSTCPTAASSSPGDALVTHEPYTGRARPADRVRRGQRRRRRRRSRRCSAHRRDRRAASSCPGTAARGPAGRRTPSTAPASAGPHRLADGMETACCSALAELAVRVGANVQPGQIVAVGVRARQGVPRPRRRRGGLQGRRELRRRRSYFDPWVKRARIAHAPDDTLEFVPPGTASACSPSASERAARIGFSGPVAPGVLDGLDPVRAGRDRLPAVKESAKVLSDRTTNWTIVPVPVAPWARARPPRPRAGRRARAGCGSRSLHVCRLDEDDPGAAWTERARPARSPSADAPHRARLRRAALRGPGHRPHRRPAARPPLAGRRHGDRRRHRHMANLPTEEVFTSPDPERADGVVTSTKPLVLIDGTVVARPGRALRGRPHHRARPPRPPQETMRTIINTDEGAARLGEIALVDAEGRIGALDTVFYDTLLDENAASPPRDRRRLPVRRRPTTRATASTSPRSTSTS